MAKLQDLIRRMENIYLEIEKSVPPAAFRQFRQKLSQSCQLNLQALTLTVQALEERNLSLLPKINELTFQANDAKTAADEELLNIFRKYNIK